MLFLKSPLENTEGYVGLCRSQSEQEKHLAVQRCKHLLAARLYGGQQGRAKLRDLVLHSANAGVKGRGYKGAGVAIHCRDYVVRFGPVVLAVRPHKVQPLEAAARPAPLHARTAEHWVHSLHKETCQQPTPSELQGVIIAVKKEIGEVVFGHITNKDVQKTPDCKTGSLSVNPFQKRTYQ